MRITTALCLTMAAALATSAWAGCEADQSAPSRPRTTTILTPDEKAKDNAEKRALEAPQRQLPTSGSEYPGESKANTPDDQKVITADAMDVRLSPYGSSRGPTTDYDQDNFHPGPMPHLAEKPGTTPAVGSTPVPGTPWAADHSWGEVLPLTNAPHRAWPEIQANYVAADTKHNPVYYYNVQEHLPIPQNKGTIISDSLSNAMEAPWFYVNTAILPVMMIFEPPLAQRTTERLGHDANYLGHLPVDGDVIPAPVPGVIKWEYPFLHQNQMDASASTEPATTQTEGIPMVAPTLKTSATTAPISH